MKEYIKPEIEIFELIAPMNMMTASASTPKPEELAEGENFFDYDWEAEQL